MLLDRLIGYRGFKALALRRRERRSPVLHGHGPGAAVLDHAPELRGGDRRSAAELVGVSRRAAWPRRAAVSRWRRRRSAVGAAAAAARKSAVGEPGKGAAILSERRRGLDADRARPRRAMSRRRPPVSSVLAPVPFGGVDPLYVMGSDGLLRTLRVSDGAMTAPMAPFLPPNARPSSLTFINGVVYTSTSHGCGAVPNGVWALDLIGRQQGHDLAYWRRARRGQRRARPSAPTARSTSRRRRTPPPAPNRYASSVVALDPATLQAKDWFSADGADFNASPVVFKHKDRELAAVSGNDGRLYLLDTTSLGGADHRTPLHVTAKYSAPGTRRRPGDMGGRRTRGGSSPRSRADPRQASRLPPMVLRRRAASSRSSS